MSTGRIALLGGKPMFERPLPVGQLYFPSWERYAAAMRGIFDRQYYTNHGPLAQQFEEKLQSFLGVRHAICVTNATIGLMMAADAMGLKGRVVLPSFTFIASTQSLTWAGLEPVFCDVDPRTHQMDVAKAAALLDGSVGAIMAVNLWGGACDVAGLEALAESARVQLYFDSAHAIGCRIGDRPVGGFGRLEVFSFHATKILGSTEGGCVCTDDDELAARLRNIRSSYGAGPPVPVSRTANGRMSEAQAAIGLMSLEDFERNRDNNERLFRAYESGLAGIPGIHLVAPSGVTRSNYQYVVCEIDEAAYGISRDGLFEALRAENVLARRYFHPGNHRTLPYDAGPAGALPVTERLCATCLQLPIGALVETEAVGRICEFVSRARGAAREIQARVAGASPPGGAGSSV